MSENIALAKQIDILISLQDIDGQIYKLKDSKEKKPNELTQINAEFQAKTKSVKQDEESFTQLQLKRKEKEGLLSLKEENIKKLKGQLYQIKTNKEYVAMQNEIEGQKADKSTMEDEILFLMDEIDKLKAEVTKEKETLAIEEAKLKEQERAIKAELEEIEKKLTQLNLEREVVAPQVEEDILKKYERVLVNKYGLAIVPVNDNACQGCHMSLPPQVINQIRLKQELIICENCSRFLYIKD